MEQDLAALTPWLNPVALSFMMSKKLILVVMTIISLAPEIPPDPYDIEAGLAKKLMSHYDMELTPEEQKAYGYAMQNSDEKGPYDGFTGKRVTEVWNLSDGCGGDDEHLH